MPKSNSSSSNQPSPLPAGARPTVADQRAAGHPTIAGFAGIPRPQDPSNTDGVVLPQFELSPLPAVPGYRVIREIARGGMGVVYEAEQISLGRTVALKMIASGRLGNEHLLRRFAEEAAVVAKLQHPNIVQIFETGQYDGMPFFALEFVGGGTLSRHLQGRPIPQQFAVPFCRTLALAVDYAHRQGVIHRDLKPGNVLLASADVANTAARADHEWLPKIADFGLAKRVGGDSHLTETGDILGTPSYMAPEQARGWHDRIGPPTDVYALGAMFYEMLTGRPPFIGATALDTLEQLGRDDPIRPSRLQPRLPRDLDTICLKCLAKEPSRRYPTAAALADDLERFQQGQPILARRVGRLEQTWKWVRRRPGLTLLLLALVLVTLAGSGGVLWQWGKAVDALEKLQLARDDEAAQRARAESSLYSSNLARSRLEFELNNVPAARDVLERCPPALRGWEWHMQHLLLEQSYRSTFNRLNEPSWTSDLQFSDDGKILATAGGGNPYYRTWGPQSVRGGGVKWWHWDKLDCFLGTPLFPHVIQRMQMADEGRRLFVTTADGFLRVHQIEEQRQIAELGGLAVPQQGSCAPTAVTADGRTVFALRADKQLMAWNVDSGQTRLLGWRANHSGILRVDRAGTRLALAETDGIGGANCTLRAWELPAMKPISLEGVQGEFEALAISQDGTLLAGSQRSTIKVWDLQRTPGRLLHLLTGHTGNNHALAFSSENRRLASGGDDTVVRVWNVNQGKQERQFRQHGRPIAALAFHPDGNRLVSGERGPHLLEWDLTANRETGAVLTTPTIPYREPEALAIAADGKTLWTMLRTGHLQRIDIATQWTTNVCRLEVMDRWAVPATMMQFDYTGTRLVGVTRTDRGVAKVWDTSDGREIATLNKQRSDLNLVAISSDGRRAAVCGAYHDAQHNPSVLTGELGVWDIAGKRMIFQQYFPYRTPTNIALSHDGQKVAASWEKHPPPKDGPRIYEIVVYDVNSDRQDQQIDCQVFFPRSLVFDSLGKRLASAGLEPGNKPRGLIRIFDLTQKTSVEVDTDVTGTVDVSFSFDGKRLAIAVDKMVAIHNAETLEELTRLRGPAQRISHTNGFNARVRFSLDGNTLAAVTHDVVWPTNVWSTPHDTRAHGTAESGESSETPEIRERRALVWHAHEAANSLENRDFTAFRHHVRIWREKLKQYPENPAFTLGLAEILAGGANWSEALEIYRDFSYQQPDWEEEVPHGMAALTLWLNDNKTYHQALPRWRASLERARDPITRIYHAWACTLHADAKGDYTHVAKVLEKMTPKEVEGLGPRYFHALGQIHYRAGRFQEALIALQRSIDLHAQWNQEAMNYPLLAMSHLRLGQRNEAKNWLQRANDAESAELARGAETETLPWAPRWYDWLSFRVSCREARAAMEE